MAKVQKSIAYLIIIPYKIKNISIKLKVLFILVLQRKT